jgi:hypothetical protein
MESEHFAVSRDFFFLAWVFTGAALGCILSRFKGGTSTRFRNRVIALAFCFLSGMVAALAAAFIFSGAAVFLEKFLYILGGTLALLLVLAFRFPRTAGFPLILAAGLIVVWLGVSFLRYPKLEAGIPGSLVASVTRRGNGRFLVRTAAGPRGELSTPFTVEVSGGVLEFTLEHITCAPLFPLVGGETRGIITEIRDNGRVLYSVPLGAGIPPGASPDKVHGTALVGDGLPGARFLVYFDGNGLVCR